MELSLDGLLTAEALKFTFTERTQDEVLARIREVVGGADVLGLFRIETLLPALTLESARTLAPDVLDDELLGKYTVETWHTYVGAPRALFGKVLDYLDFAVEKMINHRGLSASRSVGKLTEYAWLLGLDDVVRRMDEAPYAQYGAPKVKILAEALRAWPGPGSCHGPEGVAQLERMAAGLPCVDDCDEGCGV